MHLLLGFMLSMCFLFDYTYIVCTLYHILCFYYSKSLLLLNLLNLVLSLILIFSCSNLLVLNICVALWLCQDRFMFHAEGNNRFMFHTERNKVGLFVTQSPNKEMYDNTLVFCLILLPIKRCVTTYQFLFSFYSSFFSFWHLMFSYSREWATLPSQICFSNHGS